MNVSVKMPHRAWYFLLCYLAYGSYTVNFVMLELLRPKFMLLYDLDIMHMAPFYVIVFWGMLVGSIIFSILINIINYRTCFIWLWIIQILGLVKLFSLSPIIISTPVIHQLKSGMLLMGIANGGIFAVIHPLIALIFQRPNQSNTKIMNLLHTSWPLFSIITCLLQTLLFKYDLDWFWNVYVMLFLSCVYLVIAVFLPLPIQVQAHRIPISTRFKSIVRPGYALLLFCMLFSCIVQYSPAIWVRHWLEIDLKILPLYYVIFANGLQFVFRLLAGPIAQKISPPGLLGLAAILSTASLYFLSLSTHIIPVLFGVGLLVVSVSWYWPTYIAIVADRYPLSGGLGIGLMNATAFFSLIQSVPEFSQLIEAENPHEAFSDLAWFAVFLFILLIGVYIAFRTQGGYKTLSTYDRSA